MKKMLHIAYSGLGGHGAVLFSLLENQFLLGVTHIVLFVGVEQPRKEYVERCEKLSIKHAYIARDSVTSYFRFVLDIFRYLIKNNPGYIFAHGMAAVPAVSLFKLFFPGKKNVILRETQAHHLKSRHDWICLLLANFIFDRIVYLTDEAKSGAKAKLQFLHRDRKSIVIGNGLDTIYFAPHNSCSDSRVIKIGMQSRLQSNKDHRTLIDAFNMLNCRNSSFDLSLHIAGEGATLESLRDYVHSLALGNKIFFHGMLGQSDLKKFLSNLYIYVHCTHGETMSTAIMQAFSMGLPVIASDVSGVSNMVTNGNGLLYRPGDAFHLAENMEKIIRDPNLKKSLAEQARRCAELNFSNSILTKKYTDVFSNNA